MFTPFKTFGNEFQKNENGVGLGLSISKKLVGKLGPVEKIFI